MKKLFADGTTPAQKGRRREKRTYVRRCVVCGALFRTEYKHRRNRKCPLHIRKRGRPKKSDEGGKDCQRAINGRHINGR